MRGCPGAKHERRPKGGSDGGAASNDTPYDTPAPSPAIVSAEIEKKAPCATRGSAGPSARSSPFQGWISRRTRPM